MRFLGLDEPRLDFFLVLGALGSGILLRTYQFLSATSLWFDELAVARNIVDRSFSDLVSQPLEHLQVAPGAFLAAVKASTIVLGSGELGLRLVPWMFSLLSIFLSWRLAVRFLSGPGLWTSLFVFSASPALIWYAGELKQYSGDVAMTALIVLIALRVLDDGDSSRPVAYGLLGAVAILFSQPGLVTAAVVGLLMAIKAIHGDSRIQARALFVLLGIWVIAGFISATWALLVTSSMTRGYMEVFWAPAFLTSVLDPVGFLLEVPGRLMAVCRFFLSGMETPTTVTLAVITPPMCLVVVGSVGLLKKGLGTGLLVFSPILGGILSASAGLLPMGGRMNLYFGWPLVLGIGYGVLLIQRWKQPLGVWVGLVVTASLWLLALAGSPIPFRAQETKPVLSELRSRLQDPDQVYVYYGARHAMEFYGRRAGLTSWTQGACHRFDTRAYFREVDQFRGAKRVWVFYTHAHPAYREMEDILTYLDAIGHRVDSIPDPFSLAGQMASGAVLYDLSDPARLSRSSHRTQPVSPADGEGLRSCDAELMADAPGRIDRFLLRFLEWRGLHRD